MPVATGPLWGLDAKTDAALHILDNAIRGYRPDIEDERDALLFGRMCCDNLVEVLRMGERS